MGLETSTTMRRTMLIFSCFILAIGNCGGPLVMRLYFFHGGKRIWFSSWLVTAGCPIILIPLVVAYKRRKQVAMSSSPTKLIFIKSRTFAMAAIIGSLTGLDDYLYAYGLAKLPVSTSTLIIASQLAFTAIFAFLLVRQRFTPYSINAVMLLTVAAAVLGLHTGSDRPKGESNKDYLLGFFVTLASAVLYGLILPLIELMYRKANDQASGYAFALETQFVMGLFATGFCTVGMLINNDFQAIAREAKSYELGETIYYLVIVGSSLIWQCFFFGAIGIIYYSSSLMSGVIIAFLRPFTEVLAVIFYHESFHAEKGLSLVLSLWGFVSYFYAEFKKIKKTKTNNNSSNGNHVSETELTRATAEP